MQFNAADMDGALSLANKALAVKSGYQPALTVGDNIKTYDEYIGYLNQALSEYNSADIYDANSYICKVPTNSIGSLARNKYSTLISRVSNDYPNRSNPVEITSKDASATKGSYSYFGGYSSGYGTVYFTMKNKLSRSVQVTVKANINSYTRTSTYTLGAYETYSGSIYFSSLSTLGSSYIVSIDGGKWQVNDIYLQ